MAASSGLSKKDEEKIKRNNFFNLSSDEDTNGEQEEEDDDEEEKLNKEKIKKWDWDREENKNLYFHKEAKHVVSEQSQSKRFKPDTDSRDNNNQASGVIKSNLFRIESDSSVKFNLLGHTNSVNRIHWCRKHQHNNILLASSMDR